MWIVKAFYRRDLAPLDIDDQLEQAAGYAIHAKANGSGQGGQWNGRWWWFHSAGVAEYVVRKVKTCGPDGMYDRRALRVSLREARTDEIAQAAARGLDCGPPEMMDAVCEWPDGERRAVLVVMDNGIEARVIWDERLTLLGGDQQARQMEDTVPSRWLYYCAGEVS